MELRHLRYFTALADELSFTRAAEKVHITQSTLSHQIKQLEAELGQQLFSRIGKRVVITEAGEMLLSGVTRALREIDDGVRSLKGGAGPMLGELRIGSTYTFNIKFVPVCVATFLKRYPTNSVTVLELSADDVEEQLAREEIEIGVAYRPALRPGFIFEPLYIDEMVLAVGMNHQFASRKRIRLAELHRHELVLQTRGSDTRQILDSCFRSVSAEPVVAAEMNAAGPMISLVQEFNIGAIVSKHLASGFERVRFIPLESPTPLRTAGILLKTDRPKSLACQSFISVIRKTIADAKLNLPRKGESGSFPATMFARHALSGSRAQTPRSSSHLGDSRTIVSDARAKTKAS
jgi:LysR family transcriptional regulator, cyn operon transcriptional activator